MTTIIEAPGHADKLRCSLEDAFNEAITALLHAKDAHARREHWQASTHTRAMERHLRTIIALEDSLVSWENRVKAGVA